MPAAAATLPPPQEYLPFAPGTFRQAMGLRPLAPDAWIELDHSLPDELAMKRSLLRDHPSQTMAALPEAWEAGREGLLLLVDHLTRHFPQWYSREGDVVRNQLTDERHVIPGHPGDRMHPLEVAGRLVQEDWCMLQDAEAGFRLTAGCVCFPSRWSLPEKIGRPLADVHDGVPLYAEQIGRPTDRFMQALRPDRPVWRLNWSLHDSPRLFRPDAPPMWPGEALTPDEVPAKVWLRVERQTLRRLPETGAIAFAIRTYVRPLSDFTVRPQVAADMAAALRSWPEDVVRYKGCASCREPVLAWLESRQDQSDESQRGKLEAD